MTSEEERREAQIEALIGIIGSMLTLVDANTDAADLWPETMRRGTPDEIRQVTAELADVLPAALLRAFGEAKRSASAPRRSRRHE
jgi:hypothetical protein